MSSAALILAPSEDAQSPAALLARSLCDESGFPSTAVVHLATAGLSPREVLATARGLRAVLQPGGLLLLVIEALARLGPDEEVLLELGHEKLLDLAALDEVLAAPPQLAVVRILDLERAPDAPFVLRETALLSSRSRWISLGAVHDPGQPRVGLAQHLVDGLRAAHAGPLPDGVLDPLDLALQQIWLQDGAEHLSVQLPRQLEHRRHLQLLLHPSRRGAVAPRTQEKPNALPSAPEIAEAPAPTEGIPGAEELGTAPTEARPALSGAKRLEGEVLDGRYAIRDRLGQGGMGAVYRAEQLSVQRDVALKVVRPARAMDDNGVARFSREMQVIGRMHHPNIVPIYDCGRTEAGLFYMAMELLEGESLRAFLGRTPVPPLGWTLSVVDDVCRALREAHRNGIVHRDLKPDNIFLWDVGEELPVARLLDFGMARLRKEVDRAGRLTLTGTVLGTPLYMSPEQALGREVDHRADIYSLGIVLYEMLCGRVPFYGTGLGILIQHAHQAPPPLTPAPELGAVPPGILELVQRCLAKDPTDRPASIDELRATLRSGSALPHQGLLSRAALPTPPASEQGQPAARPGPLATPTADGADDSDPSLVGIAPTVGPPALLPDPHPDQDILGDSSLEVARPPLPRPFAEDLPAPTETGLRAPGAESTRGGPSGAALASLIVVGLLVLGGIGLVAWLLLRGA